MSANFEPRRVFSGSSWEPKVGYSRAVRVGTHVWVSGCAPVKDGRLVGDGDPEAQATRCIEIITDSLKQLGAGPEHVVRTRIYCANAERDWEAIGRAHAAAFGANPPATALVQVQLIEAGMLVEIEADAFVPEQA
jgi:enamine deaminase RidA (YjgF/YER057c/UK114 family)